MKRIALLVCVLAIVPFATAKNNLGIHDTGRVIFHNPTRVAGSLLPAGEYIVRHTMEGQEHIMVFESVDHKVPPVKAKCQLVQLAGKADQTRTVFEVNVANEHVLQELVFAGDTAKHVFYPGEVLIVGRFAEASGGFPVNASIVAILRHAEVNQRVSGAELVLARKGLAR